MERNVPVSESSKWLHFLSRVVTFSFELVTFSFERLHFLSRGGYIFFREWLHFLSRVVTFSFETIYKKNIIQEEYYTRRIRIQEEIIQEE